VVKWYALLLFFLLPFGVLAQNLSNYKPLQAQNPIPEEFRQLSSEKYKSAQKKLDRDRDGKQRTRDKTISCWKATL